MERRSSGLGTHTQCHRPPAKEKTAPGKKFLPYRPVALTSRGHPRGYGDEQAGGAANLQKQREGIQDGEGVSPERRQFFSWLKGILSGLLDFFG